jgi:hypothetical protein
MTSFEAYATNLGLFVKLKIGYPISDKAKINGKLSGGFQKIEVSQNSYTRSTWTFLEGIHQIDSYEVLKAGANIQTGFVLKISSIANDEIPLELSMEQVSQYYDDDAEENCWVYYNDYRALYKPVYVKTEDVLVAEEFDVKTLRSLQVDSFETPLKMEVKQCVEGNYGKNESRTVDLASVVTYEDIERLLTPEFLLHERPCTLSSSQMYSIVRRHIKDNIDAKYATITSDYDFCFTVKRKVAIKPFVNKTEIKNARGGSYSQPKFKINSVTHKEVEIFEMTTQEKPYNSYTPISSYSAKSLKEMQEFILSYLGSLMAEINKPVQECQHCGGTGHLVTGKINANEHL